MKNKIIKITGDEKGFISVIIAGIHGNEKCGLEAFKKIIPHLKLDKGQVFFIYGNPLAIEKKVRQTDENLNRMFISPDKLSKKQKNSYEYKRAKFLKKYLNKADALLDIHSSPTPKSKSFLICEKNSKKISSKLPINLIVSGFDKIQPGGTDYYMNKNGKIGICIECGYSKNSNSTKIAIKAIKNFLIVQGHIKGKIKNNKQNLVQIYYMHTIKSSKFKLSKRFKDFEKVQKNQIIGWDGKNEIKSPKNSIILFAKNGNKTGQEVFLLGK